MRRTSSAAEKRHLERVADMPCALCIFLSLGDSPGEVHHVRARHGWGRTSHYAAISLCPPHHRNDRHAIHNMGRDEFAAHHGVSEMDLLAQTLNALGVVLEDE